MSHPAPFHGSRAGLDHPRVIKNFDRGDEFDHHSDHPQEFPPVNISKPLLNGAQAVQWVRKALEDGITPYPPNSSSQLFIPRELLSGLMTLKTISQVVDYLSCCSNLPPAAKKQLAQEVCFGGGPKHRPPCKKLLAVLILLNLEENFVKLIKGNVDDNNDDGINDLCLPLHVVSESDGTKNLKCRNSKHNHHAINQYGKKQRLDVSQYTYAVMSPYFTKPPNQHVHYILDNNDVLPIVQSTDREPSGARDLKRNKGMSTYGGFSRVQCVRFHHSHFHFDSEDLPEGSKLFALKRLNSTKVDDFNIELASLLNCQNGGNQHLIKLLFTFEIKGARSTDSSEFCLVFPWADGNLWHFWKVYQDPSNRDDRTIWMAEQCLELVKALRHVHNERELDLNRLPDVDEKNLELYGRHGDVKAENTLWFESENILVMADFGLGRLHSKISASNDTKSLAKTATYRAPEFDMADGKISRACDIYSMGCMFLEFVTWHLQGWESVDDAFSQHRLEMDHHTFETDIFFKIKESSGAHKTAIRKEKVTTWIEQLKRNPHCTPYHIQFLDVIDKNMLEPNRHKRIKCSSLQRKLALFVETCHRDPSYYKEPAQHLVHPN
ncbi:MAG: hypothetical protein Q9160_002822 [Pyrenula sp. 1 TL-2023]